ncbi:MAG: InlB B-repeat-containing protein [Clostridiales bacterium]|nr:InlB B-repeat-containing protein [Clostridiales bacterium]
MKCTPLTVLTLKAQWRANEYAVTLNANGTDNAEGFTKNAVYEEGKTGTVTFNVTYDKTYLDGYKTIADSAEDLPTAYLTGYIFDGWYTIKDSDITTKNTSASGNDNAKYLVTKDTFYNTVNGKTYETGKAVPKAHTLYAHWTAITYTVHYNANDATGGSTADTKHQYDVSEDIRDTKGNLNENGFERIYTVTYNINDSTQSNGTTAASYAAPLSAANTTSTYTFEGWSAYEAKDVNTAHSESWNLSSAANSGSVYHNNLSSTQGATVQMYAMWDSHEITLPTPSRTGYTFKGWYTVKYSRTQAAAQANFIGNGGDTWTPEADITLYAYWTPDTYEVTLDSENYSTQSSMVDHAATNAGTVKVTATYDSPMPAATMPAKSGYTFNGYFVTKTAAAAASAADYYTNANISGDQYYNANGSSAKNWVIASDTTLYAKWSRNEYTVTYKNAVALDENGNAFEGAVMPQDDVRLVANDGTLTNNNSFTNGTGFRFDNEKNTIEATLQANPLGGTTAATWEVPFILRKAQAKGYDFIGWTLTATGGKFRTGMGTTADPYRELDTLVVKYTGEDAIGFFDKDGNAVNIDNKTLNDVLETEGNSYTLENAAYMYIPIGSYGHVTASAIWQVKAWDVVFNVNTSALTVHNPPKTHSNCPYETNGSYSVRVRYDYAVPAVGKATSGATENTALVMPTYEGYTFLGYFTQATGGTKYYTADGTPCHGNSTDHPLWKESETTQNLYAHWQENTYEITYALDGGTLPAGAADGTGEGSKAQYSISNTDYTLPAPTKTGYTFDYWTVEDEGTYSNSNWRVFDNVNSVEGNQIASGTNMTGRFGNVTLKANWHINQSTLIVKVGGGETWTYTVPDKSQILKVTGWSESDTSVYNAETGVITVTGDGSEHSVVRITAPYGTVLDNIPAPAKTGYKLKNFTPDNTNTDTSVGGVFTQGSTTETRHRATADIENSEDKRETETINVFTFGSYTFGAIDGESFTISTYGSGNWNAITYQVVFEGTQKDTGEMVNETQKAANEPKNVWWLKYGENSDLPANAFSKAGYDFVGWTSALFNWQKDKLYSDSGNTQEIEQLIWRQGVAMADGRDSGGNTVKVQKFTARTVNYYLDGHSVRNLATEQNDAVTLYAIWKARQYTITVNRMNGKIGTDPNTMGNIDPAVFTLTGYYDEDLSTFEFKLRYTTGGSTYETSNVNSNGLPQGDSTGKYVEFTVYRNSWFAGSSTKAYLSRSGYSFKGWSSIEEEPRLETAFDQTKTLTNSVRFSRSSVQFSEVDGSASTATIYARWSPNTYKVTFDLNKPENASNDISAAFTANFDARQTANDRPKPTYRLVKDGDEKNISYELEGCYSGDTYKVITDTPALKGWTFVGWNTEKNGSGEWYDGSSTVKHYIDDKGNEYSEDELDILTVAGGANTYYRKSTQLTRIGSTAYYHDGVFKYTGSEIVSVHGRTYKKGSDINIVTVTENAKKTFKYEGDQAGQAHNLYAQWRASSYTVAYIGGSETGSNTYEYTPAAYRSNGELIGNVKQYRIETGFDDEGYLYENRIETAYAPYTQTFTYDTAQEMTANLYTLENGDEHWFLSSWKFFNESGSKDYVGGSEIADGIVDGDGKTIKVYAVWALLRISSKKGTYDFGAAAAFKVVDIAAHENAEGVSVGADSVPSNAVLTFGPALSVDGNVNTVSTKSNLETTDFSGSGYKVVEVKLSDISSSQTIIDRIANFIPGSGCSGVQTFYYELYYDGQYICEKVVMYPRNVVLYEDDSFSEGDSVFNDGHNNGAGWYKQGEGKITTNSEISTVFGYSSALDPYKLRNSADPSTKALAKLYEAGTFSGSVVTKTILTPQVPVSTTREFEFTGRGFDLVSACGSNNAALVIYVWQKDGDNYNPIAITTVDTYTGSGNELLVNGLETQVPVYHFMASEEATYLVQVYAVFLDEGGANVNSAGEKDIRSSVITQLEDYGLYVEDEIFDMKWMDENSVLNGGTGRAQAQDDDEVLSGGATVMLGYIDGIRVYDPSLGDKNEESVYLASELNAEFYNIMQYSLEGEGYRYDDGDLEYKFEPNEVYLKQNGKTAFKVLGLNGDVGEKVMVSLRAVQGAGKVEIYGKDMSNKLTIESVEHATEMYYDISGYLNGTNGYVVIQNIGTGIVAVGNVKITSETNSGARIGYLDEDDADDINSAWNAMASVPSTEYQYSFEAINEPKEIELSRVIITPDPGDNNDNPGGNNDNPGGNNDNPGGNDDPGNNDTPTGDTPKPASVRLKGNNRKDTTLDYKTTITFHADVKNAFGIVWYINIGDKTYSSDKLDPSKFTVGKDGSLTVKNVKEDFSVYFTAKDSAGKSAASQTLSFKVKNNFFAKLVAFFRTLFGSGKTVDWTD